MSLNTHDPKDSLNPKTLSDKELSINFLIAAAMQAGLGLVKDQDHIYAYATRNFNFIVNFIAHIEDVPSTITAAINTVGTIINNRFDLNETKADVDKQFELFENEIKRRTNAQA